MNFSALATNRQILRSLAGQEKVAGVGQAVMGTAGAIGRGAMAVGRGAMAVAKPIGKGVNWAWQKSMQNNGKVMGTLGLGLGGLGMYSLAKNSINRTRAAYHGFQPEVQAYTRQSPYGE